MKNELMGAVMIQIGPDDNKNLRELARVVCEIMESVAPSPTLAVDALCAAIAKIVHQTGKPGHQEEIFSEVCGTNETGGAIRLHYKAIVKGVEEGMKEAPRPDVGWFNPTSIN